MWNRIEYISDLEKIEELQLRISQLEDTIREAEEMFKRITCILETKSR